MTEQQADRLITLTSLQFGVTIGIFVALIALIITTGNKR